MKQVARIEEMINAYTILAGNPKGRERMRDQSMGVIITLRQSSKKWTVSVCTGFNWLRILSSGRLLPTRQRKIGCNINLDIS
jgi:hypothetical protein